MGARGPGWTPGGRAGRPGLILPQAVRWPAAKFIILMAKKIKKIEIKMKREKRKNRKIIERSYGRDDLRGAVPPPPSSVDN